MPGWRRRRPFASPAASYADLRVRALRALDAIRAAHDCSVVVTHGGVVRAGLAEWLSMPDEAIFRLDQSYCGVTIVEWLGGAVVRLAQPERDRGIDLR